MVWFHLDEVGRFYHASSVGVGAPCVKATAGGRVDRARYLATKNIAGSFASGVGYGYSRDQALGIRMKGVSDHHVCRTRLNELSQIHDAKPVAHVSRNCQVMSYEKKTGPVFLD